ncbi:MAG: hypothetical protein P857_104 [Candidatus Xenolissoclinum pacificiensis L6]|uniref:Uncharacterized protein n=1 Tax=Candidatus Xenolissoclinum pacificiensis L6 TaxID=1401685 RepID=W2UYL4_9RICK|nr:MAG: hypothetical protein P857_104 [Candidatus Xenolissoclinum pacificiensis L6]
MRYQGGFFQNKKFLVLLNVLVISCVVRLKNIRDSVSISGILCRVRDFFVHEIPGFCLFILNNKYLSILLSTVFHILCLLIISIHIVHVRSLDFSSSSSYLMTTDIEIGVVSNYSVQQVPGKYMDNVPEKKNNYFNDSSEYDTIHSTTPEVFTDPSKPLRIPQVGDFNKLAVRKKEPIRDRAPAKKPVGPTRNITGVLKTIESLQSNGKYAGHHTDYMGNQSDKFDANKAVVAKIVDKIKGQFANCWIVPIAAKNIEDMSVTIRVRFRQDGTIEYVNVLDREKYRNSTHYQAVANSAVQAIYKCSPLQGLDRRLYHQWQLMDMIFDPRYML